VLLCSLFLYDFTTLRRSAQCLFRPESISSRSELAPPSEPCEPRPARTFAPLETSSPVSRLCSECGRKQLPAVGHTSKGLKCVTHLSTNRLR